VEEGGSSGEIKKKRNILKRLKKSKKLFKNNSCRRDRESSPRRNRILMHSLTLNE
jgi:hypothetical protein